MSLAQRRRRETERSPLLADNPIDPIVIFLGLLAMVVMVTIYQRFLEDPVFPNVSEDAMSLFNKAILGFLMLFAGKLLFTTNRNRFDQIFGIKFNASQDAIPYIGATVAYMAIQIIGFTLIDVNLFQVTALEIYAFYISSAVIEEILYRGGIMMIVQGLLTYFLLIGQGRFNPQRRKSVKFTRNDPIMILPNLMAILVSTVFFTLAHERYFGNPVAVFITIASGISQAVFYLVTRQLLPLIFSHGGINTIAAGGLIQRLGGSVVQ